MLCSSSYFVFMQVKIATLLTRFAKNILDLKLCSSILGALCGSILDTTICFHVCTAMHWLSLRCSTKGFPSYRALIWFCTGLGGAIFLKLKGNIIRMFKHSKRHAPIGFRTKNDSSTKALDWKRKMVSTMEVHSASKMEARS